MDDNDNDFTEINYLNKEGLNIKTEYYQNGERTSYSVNDYNNDLLISERTTTNKKDIFSSLFYVFYKFINRFYNKKIFY